MKKFSFLPVLLALSLFGCVKNNCPEVKVVQSDAANPTLVVINGEAITEKDFDTQISGRDRGAMVKAKAEMYEAQKGILDDLVFDKLVSAEAKKKNISNDEYLKKEIEDKVKKPSDGDVEKFYKEIKAQYEKNKKTAPPLNDSVKGQIRNQLNMKAMAERRQALENDLLKKNSVVFAIKEPRIEVDPGMHPFRGGEKAKVTIVEFSDFQCPYCKKGADTLREVEKKYGNKIKVYFRDYPLSFHERAKPAANASRCAMEQGKFWEAHDAMFAEQSKLKDEDLLELGKKLKLDMTKYEPCVKNMQKLADIEADMRAGEDAGVSGTPAFFINGVFLSGALPMKKFEEVIDAELKKVN